VEDLLTRLAVLALIIAYAARRLHRARRTFDTIVNNRENHKP
jgi:hypothetical protein